MALHNGWIDQMGMAAARSWRGVDGYPVYNNSRPRVRHRQVVPGGAMFCAPYGECLMALAASVMIVAVVVELQATAMGC